MNNDWRYDFVFRLLGLPLFSFCSSRTCRRTEVAPGPVPSSIEPSVKPDDDIVLAPDTQDAPPVFVANSLFLHDCFEVLTQTDEENLHLVTGSILGNTRMMERIIPLELSAQSVGGAIAADDSLAAQLIRLHDFGMLPLGYFHSHPGYGPNATCPSATDQATQAAMESCGSTILGAVFSQDGFVRFYANGWDPDVHVVGERVRKVEKNVHQLEIAKAQDI